MGTGKNSGVGCYFLLQEIFPTQGLNPDLPQRRQTLYDQSRLGSPQNFQSLFHFSFMSLLWGCASWHPNSTGWTATEWVAPRSPVLGTWLAGAVPQNPGLCSLKSACPSILPWFSDARPSVIQGCYLEYFTESSPISKSQGESEYLHRPSWGRRGSTKAAFFVVLGRFIPSRSVYYLPNISWATSEHLWTLKTIFFLLSWCLFYWSSK